MSESVTISKKRYDELLRDESMLAALDEVGVDNWSGYYDAMRVFRKHEEEEEQ